MSNEHTRADLQDTTVVQRAVPAGWAPPAGPGLPPGHQEAVAALLPGSALLIVLDGAAAGARFLLNLPETRAGRDPRSDIFLNDTTVSRHHAVFLQQQGGGYLVQDGNSLNGTYVNGQAVREKVLVPGDEIRIGKFRLTYCPAP